MHALMGNLCHSCQVQHWHRRNSEERSPGGVHACTPSQEHVSPVTSLSRQ